MFDVRMVSQRIRDARISKNLTQSNLADELEVSYQAVSNWERGNSLPDISKYADLCRILDLKLEDLLGGGSDTDAVSKFIDHRKGENTDPMTVEEIESVADLLTPEDLKETVNEHLDKITFDLKDIKRLAPFLDTETLDKLVRDNVPDDLQAIVGLAPFLSQDTLMSLVDRISSAGNLEMSWLAKIMPFLKTDSADRLVEDLEPEDIKDIRKIAPFLSQDTLISLVERISSAGNLEMSWLAKIMPFLKTDSADRLVEFLEPEDIKEIRKIAPFLRKSTIKRLLDRLDDDDIKFKTLVTVAPFLGGETIEEILEDMNVKDIGRIERIAPFISRETLKKWIEGSLKNNRED